MARRKHLEQHATAPVRTWSLQRAAINASPMREAPPIVHETLRGPGQPLDATARAFLEPRFGRDFSHVRVHTDARSAASARAVNARAYTVGRDIVFGPGQYAPHTSSGQKLLAHEIAHVVQQRDATSGSPPAAQLQLGPIGDASEREAHSAADLATSSGHPSVSRIGQQAQRVSRQIDEEDHERRDPATRHPGEPLPYREAMEATERGLYDEYVRACAGVSVLERLTRERVSPLERVQRLERRVRRLPAVFEHRRAIQERIEQDPSNLGPKLQLRDFDKLQIEPEFGPGYVLGSLADELARAQCELSKSRWEFFTFTQHGRIPGKRLLRK
jgi:hypothetical protein